MPRGNFPHVLVDSDPDYGTTVACYLDPDHAKAAFTKRYTELTKEGVVFKDDQGALECLVAYNSDGQRLEVITSDNSL